jgi:beta-glucanase (GH16 family)
MMKKILTLGILFVLGVSLSACTPTELECDEGFELNDAGTMCYEIPNTTDDDNKIPDISGPIPGDDDEDVCYGDGFDYMRDELNYTLIFEDQFEGDSLNLDNWTYEINGNGGGNQELQYYTDQNATVKDGLLTITARNESYLGMDYTSSRIVSRNKVDFKYGMVEVRAKLPAGVGTWAAIWMLPTNSVYGIWPNSGEIDIMEYVGYDDGRIFGTVHTGLFNHMDGTQKGGVYTKIDDMTTEFHTYKVEWLPDQIRFYVDDINYYTFRPTTYNVCPSYEEWPFNKSFYLIMNVAVGGNWGGVQGVDSSAFPTSMIIDYVKVYQSEEITEIG